MFHHFGAIDAKEQNCAYYPGCMLLSVLHVRNQEKCSEFL